MKTQITLTLSFNELYAAAAEHYQSKYKDAEVTILVDQTTPNINQYGYSFEDIKRFDPVRYGTNKIQNIKDFRACTGKLTGHVCGLAYAKCVIENWDEFVVEFTATSIFPRMFKGLTF